MSRNWQAANADPGDALDLEELYRRHWNDVCRYINRHFGSGPPAPEDVAQQAFLKLAAKGAITGVRNPKAFLFRSARNAMIDERRRAKAQNALIDAGLDFLDESDDLDAERVIYARQRLTIATQAIMGLSPQQRRSFLMFRLQGHSLAEIARRTGYSETGVKKQVVAALGVINKAMKAADLD